MSDVVEINGVSIEAKNFPSFVRSSQKGGVVFTNGNFSTLLGAFNCAAKGEEQDVLYAMELSMLLVKAQIASKDVLIEGKTKEHVIETLNNVYKVTSYLARKDNEKAKVIAAEALIISINGGVPINDGKNECAIDTARWDLKEIASSSVSSLELKIKAECLKAELPVVKPVNPRKNNDRLCNLDL